MPGIAGILPLKSRKPETSVVLLFIKHFGSFDQIKQMGETRFRSAYSRLCKKAGDRFAEEKGLKIYELVCNSITTRGDNRYTLLAQNQQVDLISHAQNAADELILEMQNIAATVPEYQVLREMKGVGDRLGPVIFAEIGDIRRFHSAKALVSYAGIDAPAFQSGNFESKNRHILNSRRFCN